jgi:hypothetical protein
MVRDASRPGRQKRLMPECVAAIVNATLTTTPPGKTHWSTRSMARAQGVSEKTIRNIWHQHGLQPHRVTRFKLSKDPHFVNKLRDVVGLYLQPPDKAVVFCIDEKSGIQTLDRTRPVLPLRPRGARAPNPRLHPAWDHVLVCGLAAARWRRPRHLPPEARHQRICPLPRSGRAGTAADHAIHVIFDNLSTHKSPPVQRWLRRHPRVHFHFIPTSSSWLNLVKWQAGTYFRSSLSLATD